MSKSTWLREFYCTPADKLSRRHPSTFFILHSLHKWTGALKKNLRKHNLTEPPIAFDDLSCSLCAIYRNYARIPPSLHSSLHNPPTPPLFLLPSFLLPKPSEVKMTLPFKPFFYHYKTNECVFRYFQFSRCSSMPCFPYNDFSISIQTRFHYFSFVLRYGWKKPSSLESK